MTEPNYHREHPRRGVGQFLMVFNRANGQNIGRLVDISEGGLQLRSAVPLTPEQNYQFSMVLPDPIDDRMTISFDATCRRSIQGEGEEFFYSGFQLTEIDPRYIKILQALIERL